MLCKYDFIRTYALQFTEEFEPNYGPMGQIITESMFVPDLSEEKSNIEATWFDSCVEVQMYGKVSQGIDK